MVEPVVMRIDYKLRGYNQIRSTWRYNSKRIQGDCLLLMRRTGKMAKLHDMAVIGSGAGLVIHLVVDYGSPQPLDDDNALLGANKMFVDTLVKDNILRDDDPKRLHQSIGSWEKTEKRKEFVRKIHTSNEGGR